MLTTRQKQCFDFIAARIAADGIAPSLTELADALGLESKGHVHMILTGLEARGAIRRLKRRHRAIEIINPHPGRAVQRVAYFKFDDEMKHFVPWAAPVARKTA